MKQKLLLLSLLTFGLLFVVNIDVKAQYTPTPIFVDDAIHVKRRSPKIINYKKIQKNIKKQKPNTHSISRYECQGYKGYRSNVGEKRRKLVLKNRKQYLKKVLAQR